MRTLMAIIDSQRGYLLGWAPVLFALGIGAYFSVPTEPSVLHLQVTVACAVIAVAVGWYAGPEWRPVFIALALVAAGFGVAAWRAHSVAAPVLSFRYYGPIEGRVVNVDRSASDAVRLTLDQVVLSRVPPDRRPARVRVSLHGRQGFLEPEPGQVVGMTGHLSPPSGPAEPGGFDFQRQAWFQGLGAVGYTRLPALELAPEAVDGFGLRLTRFRLALSQRVQAALPGRVGAFAAAVTTGDRSGMDIATLEALRASNLAHLLAISGLHMGLLTGFVFAAMRLGLVMLPVVGLRWPNKKIAAVGALVAGTGYLLLSGGSVATERAFIMVSVMFGAVLLGRRAITLRAVAVAAMIVLSLRPETLMGPGFQMSFAATVALVAVYGEIRDHDWSTSRWPRPLRYAVGVALSSAVAGAATAPIAAAHFNQVPHFGLIANMAAVPVMGAVVIPSAVLAALLAPFGLSFMGFEIMAPAIAWILKVAETVSGWSGALSLVPTPGATVLPMIALGFVFIVIWNGHARWAGAIPVIAAFWLWSQVDRPTVLIADSGSLVGILGPEGRAVSKSRGDGFAARSWLENDGDGAEQEIAFARWDYHLGNRLHQVSSGGLNFIHATGKKATAVALSRCLTVDFVVVNAKAIQPAGCTVYGPDQLTATGSIAIYEAHGASETITARAVQGARLWSQ
ncbi:MAG: ComEC/Rec2 family competence protein [Pseudomonadota bacterium]